MIDKAAIYLLAGMGLFSCILFAAVWMCSAARAVWLYFNWSVSRALRARRLARKIRREAA
jgi:hypothetical protein